MGEPRREGSTVGRAARAAVLLVAAAALVSACTAPRPPLFAPSRSVAGDVLLFRPEVRLGGTGTRPAEAVLVDRLLDELRTALSANGVDLAVASGDPSMEAARSATFEAWRRERAGSRGRMRDGAALGVEGALLPARQRGAAVVVAAVMARQGLFVPEGEYVPRPSGELVELPDQEFDYEIPRASDYADLAVHLDLLLVDAATGAVIAHRRASWPASDDRDVAAVLPRLVQIVTRGLTGTP